MNQKTKYTLRTCLGAAFAALLINPLASYAGTYPLGGFFVECTLVISCTCRCG